MRSPHELRIRSRPLLETDTDYISEVVPSWHADGTRIPSLGLGVTPASGTQVKTRSMGAQDILVGPRPTAGELEVGSRGGERRLEHLRSVLRSAEERKVIREARLRHLGVNFIRKIPEQVGTEILHWW